MGGRKVQGLGLLCTKGAARNDNLRVQELVLQLETPERVAQGGVDAPSVEAFKARLDVALGSSVWWLVTLHIAGGVGTDGHCGPLQPRPFYGCMKRSPS